MSNVDPFRLKLLMKVVFPFMIVIRDTDIHRSRIDTDLGVVPDMIRFFGTEGDLGDDQGVVGVTVSTVKCTD